MSWYKDFISTNPHRMKPVLSGRDSLFELIEEVLNQNPNDNNELTEVIEEAKGEKTSYSIVYEPILFDPNWLTDANAAKTRGQKRFRAAVENVPGDIDDFETFINNMNAFVAATPEGTAEAVSRAEILRAMYNIMGSKEAARKSVRWFSFEQLLAEVVGGKVIPTGEPGVSDVEFGNEGFSLKFIDPKAKIKGSLKQLAIELEQRPQVKYIVAHKYPGEKIVFNEFVVDEALLQQWSQDKSIVSASKPTQFVVKLDNVGTPVKSYTLNLSGIPEKTEEIFELLNQRFSNLFSSLQELVEAADQLTYKGDGEVKEKAAVTKAKAEKTRSGAEEIEKQS